jgi:release factor glutamine methyltransferase
MKGEEWTVMKTLRWTAAYFQTHGIEQSRTDAEVLLAHALSITRIEIYTNHDKPLHAEELKTFKSFIQRRITHEPVAYITGKKEFWSLELTVTPDVLVPRPETECLVEAVLDVMVDREAGNNILDMGTGSGAIVCALASERPRNRYYAVDRSESALLVARRNATRYGLERAIAFSRGNWFEGVEGMQRQFDIIVSNPPYIPQHQIKKLPPEIARYEPLCAIDGGADGLDAFRSILHAAPDYLAPDGKIFLEIGFDQRPAVSAIIEEVGCYRDFVCRKDYAAKDRVVQSGI